MIQRYVSDKNFYKNGNGLVTDELPKPDPFLFNDYALPFLGPSSELYYFFSRATTLLLYALACFVLQLHLLFRSNLQMNLRKIPMSVFDQQKTHHLSRLLSIKHKP